MSSRARNLALLVLTLTCVLAVAELRAQTRDPVSDIVGLWKTKRYSGTDAKGPLLIERNGTAYTGDMMGFTFPVTVNNGEFSFELPNREGGFRGRLVANTVRGIWFSAPVGELGGGTPVVLVPK